MRKHLIAFLGFLSGVMVYYMKAPERDLASVQDEYHQEQTTSVSTAMAAPAPAPVTVIPVTTQTFDPASEDTEFFEGLPRGMRLAPNVRAVPEDEYTEGKILLRKNGFIFIRSQGSAANVVYDHRLNTFHPVTATIKVSGVDENIRQEILKKWEEYHYNPDLGIQYVQSSHENLFDDYKELKKTGARASLEIIQAVYQNR